MFCSKLKDAANKAVVKEYSTQLDSLRGTLIPTRQVSIFADEKRLREDISDVYQALCTQEAAPSNLQIERIKVLSTDLKKATDKLVSINNLYQDKVKAIFIKEKIDMDKP